MITLIGISYIDIGKYIRAFDDTPEGKKTKIYTLCNAKNELIHLGTIKWNSAWRKYCYYPIEEIVLDSKCLQDIYEFMNKLNKK